MKREAERLIHEGKMPTLEQLCAAVIEARKRYAVKIRSARREAQEVRWRKPTPEQRAKVREEIEMMGRGREEYLKWLRERKRRVN